MVQDVWDGKPTYRKSYAGNLLVWSDLTLNLSFKVKRQWVGIFWCQIWPLAPPSRSNDGLLALVSCLSGGYRFASVLWCVGLVKFANLYDLSNSCNTFLIAKLLHNRTRSNLTWNKAYLYYMYLMSFSSMKPFHKVRY